MNPPRRIAFVLWSGDPGGAEGLTLEVARAMAARGWAEPGIVFVREVGAQHARVAGLEHVALGLSRGREVLTHPRAFAAAVRRLGPDGAVLASSGFMSAALRLGGYRGTLVAVEHGRILHRPGPRQRVQQALSRMASDRVVAVSQTVAEALRAHGHRAVEVVPNGVDARVFSPGEPRREGPVRLGFAGRLVAGKGLDVLLDAYGRMTAAAATELLVAGDGPLRPAAEARARSLGRPVRFLGLVADMPALWRSCDVAVVPSSTLVESFSLVAVEAMACGLPVVATDRGGLAEVVAPGRTGTLVAPDDAAALAAALDRYADAPDLRARHGAAGRERAVERYSLERTAEGYLRLLG